MSLILSCPNVSLHTRFLEDPFSPAELFANCIAPVPPTEAAKPAAALRTPDASTERFVPTKSVMESPPIRRAPPDMVSPFDDESPAVPIPPVNVEEADDILRSEPLREMPAVEFK